MKKSVAVRGRPVDPNKQIAQKAKLLAAAQSLLTEKPYGQISIRELAQRAEINSAMVSYYFNNKEGLFITLLDEMSASHFMNMKNIAKANNPIKAFISNIIAMLNDNSSFAQLIHQELANSNSALSTIFIERFPKKMATFLPQLIKKNTAIKDDIKAKYAAFSLINMIIMPFMNKNIRQNAWQISDLEMQSNDWIEHIYQQFIYGCSARTNTTDTDQNR
ncbi:MAG: TetR family transcriptional regulator [Gammaproteobacteria bacterium]|nr:MAG: TetR family transcriptional regulator [Gammaproteobacteria bacterium]